MCAFQPLAGRIYKFYNPKWVFMSCIGIFELGSLICGAAPNSTALIVGRAIAGLGSSGLFSGMMTIIVYLVPLQKRPAWTGSLGAIFAVASVAGPLLGGALADKGSWRWCFYINLPIGAFTLVVLAFVLRLPGNNTKVSAREQIRQLDPIGTSLFMPAIVCLLLALQWGGTTYDWSSARIIVLLVLSGLLFSAFVCVEHWQQENATIPPRIIKNRSVAAGTIFAFFSGGSMMTMSYFLPIWFQAIKGSSAVHSGIMNLPAILGITVASMVAGFGTKKIGYYTQFMYLSTVLSSIGAGLICTFTTNTAHPAWIGYQFLWGFGLGLGMQQPSVAAQTVLPKKDVSIGATLPYFTQTLGGSIFVSVANNVFDNKLAEGLRSIPGVNSNVVTNVGATDLRSVIPKQYLHSVLVVYNNALRNAFYVSAALAAATIIGSLAMEWKSLKKAAAEQQAAAMATNSASAQGSTPISAAADVKDVEKQDAQAQELTEAKEKVEKP